MKNKIKGIKDIMIKAINLINIVVLFHDL